MKKAKDQIFSNPIEQIVDFKFDEKVVNVFPDMINRSVPGYSTIISIVGMLTRQHVQSDTNLYDLGCSLGAATLSMRRNIIADGCKIVAVDNSEAMILRCRELIEMDNSIAPVDVVLGDLQNIEIKNASVVVLNFTLQFIPLEKRDVIIKKIFDGMIEGGILILSEKIKFSHGKLNEELIEMYHSFKRLMGYSELEVSQKRTALENVLIPETFKTHKARALRAGFKTCEIWFQCFNFTSMILKK